MSETETPVDPAQIVTLTMPLGMVNVIFAILGKVAAPSEETNPIRDHIRNQVVPQLEKPKKKGKGPKGLVGKK